MRLPKRVSARMLNLDGASYSVVSGSALEQNAIGLLGMCALTRPVCRHRDRTNGAYSMTSFEATLLPFIAFIFRGVVTFELRI